VIWVTGSAFTEEIAGAGLLRRVRARNGRVQRADELSGDLYEEPEIQ